MKYEITLQIGLFKRKVFAKPSKVWKPVTDMIINTSSLPLRKHFLWCVYRLTDEATVRYQKHALSNIFIRRNNVNWGKNFTIWELTIIIPYHLYCKADRLHSMPIVNIWVKFWKWVEVVEVDFDFSSSVWIEVSYILMLFSKKSIVLDYKTRQILSDRIST